MKQYQKLSAHYYDVSKPVGTSLDGDLEFYYKKIKDKSSVLEAGVGTGRLLIPYLKKGIAIDGIDLSKEMLEICEQKFAEHKVRTELVCGDVAQYDFDKKYEAIIVPTGTFCLFENITDVLVNFEKHLTDDGILLFDLIFPNTFQLGQSYTYNLEISQDNRILLTDTHQDINWTAQSTTELLRYDQWENGRLVESELQEFKIYWYGIEEMRMLLEKNGFTQIEFWGGYKEKLDPRETYDVVSVLAQR